MSEVWESGVQCCLMMGRLIRGGGGWDGWMDGWMDVGLMAEIFSLIRLSRFRSKCLWANIVASSRLVSLSMKPSMGA